MNSKPAKEKCSDVGIMLILIGIVCIVAGVIIDIASRVAKQAPIKEPAVQTLERAPIIDSYAMTDDNITPHRPRGGAHVITWVNVKDSY